MALRFSSEQSYRPTKQLRVPIQQLQPAAQQQHPHPSKPRCHQINQPFLTAASQLINTVIPINSEKGRRTTKPRLNPATSTSNWAADEHEHWIILNKQKWSANLRPNQSSQTSPNQSNLELIRAKWRLIDKLFPAFYPWNRS